jgi:hypothetical protein
VVELGYFLSRGRIPLPRPASQLPREVASGAAEVGPTLLGSTACKHGAMLPSMHSTMHLYPINGKASTPWSYRDAVRAAVMVGVDLDPANNGKISKWAKDYWTATHPYSAGGAVDGFSTGT